jgi:hypothetical protein
MVWSPSTPRPTEHHGHPQSTWRSRAHLDAALDKIEAVAPTTLACHHGSVKGGQITPYLRALREHDVTGVTEWNPMREPRG